MVLKSFLLEISQGRSEWQRKKSLFAGSPRFKYARALVWKKKKLLQFRVTHNRLCYLLWFYPPPNITHTHFLLQILTEQEISTFLWEKRSIPQCGALWCTRRRGVLTVLMVSEASLSSLSGPTAMLTAPPPVQPGKGQQQFRVREFGNWNRTKENLLKARSIFRVQIYLSIEQEARVAQNAARGMQTPSVANEGVWLHRWALAEVR